MKNGFVKVAAAVPAVHVADCSYNTEQILNLMARAGGMGIDVLCLPELCITGYSCLDLFRQRLLQEEAINSLLKILEFSIKIPNLTVIVGLPINYNDALYNCAAVVGQGNVYGLIPKTYISDSRDFPEKRWFSSGTNLEDNATLHFCGQHVPLTSHLIFERDEYTFGVEIGEDLWSVIPPSSYLALNGAHIIFNPASCSEMVGKTKYLTELLKGQSARCNAGYVYAACGYGESTQDMVFSGKSYILENGYILSQGTDFSMEPHFTVNDIDIERLKQDRLANSTLVSKNTTTPDGNSSYRRMELESICEAETSCLQRTFDPLPFIPKPEDFEYTCQSIISIQSEALARRVEHTHAQTVIIGVSGGLDSTLALLVAARAFDKLQRNRRGIIGITMPGFGTTDRTYTNALHLMEMLGITIREISIRDACEQHFKDIGHDINIHDTTYENSQARERTQILMDAANQMNGLVVGTGDLSELALGWATYSGDHMSMYGINGGVPKTLIRHLVTWIAHNMKDKECSDVLLDIVNTPISPELVPANDDGTIVQKTEELVGPYELHDFFLYYTLRYGFRPSKIYAMACQAFNGTDERVAFHDEKTIKHWITIFFRRFFSQQFKRSCLPDGPKIGSCGLSPRGHWLMPTDAIAAAWIAECEAL